MKKRYSPYLFAWSLVLSALLTGVGVLCQSYSETEYAGAPVLFSVVHVRGLSWEIIVSLRNEGRLPFMESLFEERGSYGDIVSDNFDTDFSIMASMMTGRWPDKHRILSSGDIKGSGSAKRFKTPIWKLLARKGQRCGVIGFPAHVEWGKDDNVIFPAGSVMNERFNETVNNYVNLMTDGVFLPEEINRKLKECVSGDLERAREIEAVAADPDIIHYFIYFEGLGRWQKRMISGNDGIPDGMKKEMIERYYVFFDGLMARLFERPDENRITIITSERGNLTGRPRYPEYFPRMRKYPSMGFFYAAGNGIRRGILPLAVNPVDLAPTILYMTGNPILRNMDGRVIFGLLEEDYYFKNPLSYR